jgi:transcriptional regulator with XRE-family HTH domain
MAPRSKAELVRSKEAVLLGRSIRRFRHEKGLSMASLSSKADVSPKHLNKIELGQGNPTVMMLHRIAETLDTTVTQIMCAAEEEEGKE